MSIVFLLESLELWGGVLYVLNLARALSDKGHPVTIVSSDPPPPWFSGGKLRFVCLDELDPSRFPAADVGVATYWTTIEKIHACRQLGQKYHLCQGYEGDYPPFEEIRGRIEESYRIPMPRLVIAEHWKTLLAERFDCSAHLIGQFVNLALFEGTGAINALSDPVKMILVGPYEIPFKGIRFALETLTGLRETMEIEIIRVSQTPISDEEKEGALCDRFLHHLTPEEMAAVYRAGHFLIHPSHPCEGYGLPPLEAVMCGCMPIVSDIPALKELPQELPRFPVGDGDALKRSIQMLVSDPRARENSWKRLYAHVAEMSVDRVADSFLKAVNLDKTHEDN